MALAEAVTRRSDRSDPVPDPICHTSAQHFDARGLAARLLMIAVTNLANRLNVATRQVAGAGWRGSSPGATPTPASAAE